jgi:predicted enzyme related to lactoylglutathione lyase
MKAKSIGLSWIVVKDFKKAVKFYTEVAGLKLVEMNEEWGWAELEGHDEGGMRLGIAGQAVEQDQDGKDCQCPLEPGQNAAVTFTVDNLEKAVQHLEKQGAALAGKIQVVPGHVKLQSVRDIEGNLFQLVEVISKESCATQE